jgi:uncharacterized protein (TIGR03086 family)
MSERSENVRLYATILSGFEGVLRSVPYDAWDNRSPCDGWSTRDVAGHAMGVVHNIAARAGVATPIDPFDNVGPIAGDDPVASFVQIHELYLSALEQPGALDIPIKSRLGEMSLDDYIGQMCSDTLVHTWDVARAAGLDVTLDPGAVGVVHAAYIERDPELMRGPGRYGPVVDVGDEINEQDQLIAFTGRDPNWR